MKQAIRSLLAGCICTLGAFTARAQFVNVGIMGNQGTLSITTDFDNNAGAAFTNASGVNIASVSGNLNQNGTVAISGGTLRIDGNASFASGASTTNSFTLQFGGNVNLQSGTTFFTNLGSLQFINANAQTLTNNLGTFLPVGNLTILKNGGSLTLAGGQRLDVTGPGSAFTLNPTVLDVPIITDNSNFIRLAQITTFTNASGLGFVRGPLERVGNGAVSHVFPIGGADNGKRFVTLDNIVSASLVRVEIGLGGSPTGISGFTPSGVRYYSVQVISGGGIPASTNLTLTYNNTSGTNDAVTSAATVSTGRSDTGTDGPFINNGSGGVGSPNGTITRALLASINAGNTSIFRIGVNLPAAGAGTLTVTYSSPTPCEYDRPRISVTGGVPAEVLNYTFEYFDGSAYSAIPGVANPVTLATATTGVNGFPLLAGGIQYRITANPQSGYSASTLSQTTALNAAVTIRLDLKVVLQGSYTGSGTTMNTNLSQTNLYNYYRSGGTAPFVANTGGSGLSLSGAPATDARNFFPVIDRPYGTTQAEAVPTGAVDVVMIGLRTTGNFSSTATDTTAGFRKYAWLMSDGSIREFRLGGGLTGPPAVPSASYVTFCGIPTGNYHVIVRHRNHIPIASTAQTLTANGVVQTVDLTNNNNVYGLAGVQGGGYIYANNKVAMFRGKVTERDRISGASRYINAFDFFTVYVNQTGTPGIYSADIDMDGVVTSTDYLQLQNNIDNLFFSTVPIW